MGSLFSFLDNDKNNSKIGNEDFDTNQLLLRDKDKTSGLFLIVFAALGNDVGAIFQDIATVRTLTDIGHEKLVLFRDRYVTGLKLRDSQQDALIKLLNDEVRFFLYHVIIVVLDQCIIAVCMLASSCRKCCGQCDSSNLQSYVRFVTGEFALISFYSCDLNTICHHVHITFHHSVLSLILLAYQTKCVSNKGMLRTQI